MKFYKRLSIDSKDPMNNSLAVEVDGRIVTVTTNSIQIPVGTTAQRPSVLNNGELRYNTSIGSSGGELEAYVGGKWEVIKTVRQSDISQQIFYNANYANTIFGPLSYNVSITKPQNVVVYVENVPQIANLNYTLISSPLSTSTTATVQIISGTVLTVKSVADFNVSNAITHSGNAISAGTTITSVNVTNSTISISNALIGTINTGDSITTTFSSGTYIKFVEDSLPVPTKPVIAILGFDGYTPPFAP